MPQKKHSPPRAPILQFKKPNINPDAVGFPTALFLVRTFSVMRFILRHSLYHSAVVYVNRECGEIKQIVFKSTRLYQSASHSLPSDTRNATLIFFFKTTFARRYIKQRMLYMIHPSQPLYALIPAARFPFLLLAVSALL